MKNWIKKNKSFVIALALVAGIFVTGTTVAYLVSTPDPAVNTITMAGVNTVIEEKVDDQPVKTDTAMLKQPVVVNEGPSNAFVRARITITPSDAGVTLLAGTWSKETEADKAFTQSSVVFDGTDFTSNGDWVYYNGYFYYTKPLKAPNSETDTVNVQTTTLFDAVKLEKSADVTIYQESVFSEDYEPGVSVDVEKIEALFLEIEK